MATVTIPGKAYVFDKVLFQVQGAINVCSITIASVTISVSPVSGNAYLDASGILRNMFTSSDLLNGMTNKIIAWSAKDGNVSIGNGNITAIYGSNETINLIGDRTINLRWVSRIGAIKTATFNLFTEEVSISNTKTVEFEGINQVIYSEKESRLTVYAASINQSDFIEYIHIQDSYMVSAQTTSGWLPVQVETKKYKNAFKPLQDFDITIILPKKQ